MCFQLFLQHLIKDKKQKTNSEIASSFLEIIVPFFNSTLIAQQWLPWHLYKSVKEHTLYMQILLGCHSYTFGQNISSIYSLAASVSSVNHSQ